MSIDRAVGVGGVDAVGQAGTANRAEGGAGDAVD